MKDSYFVETAYDVQTRYNQGVLMQEEEFRTNYKEFYWGPGEYFRSLDDPEFRIECKPLINTSIRELSDMKWGLYAIVRYVSGYDSTRLKLRFSAPAGQPGWPFLIFKGWLKGKILYPDTILEKFYGGVFGNPSFSRPPTFGYPPEKAHKNKPVVEQIVYKEVLVEEDELSFLMRMNENRRKLLEDTRLEVARENVELHNYLKSA